MVDFGKENLDLDDEDAVDRIIQCSQAAAPFFSVIYIFTYLPFIIYMVLFIFIIPSYFDYNIHNFVFQQHVKSTKYVDYMCCRVLPLWEGIATTDQAQILTLLAELCMFTGQINYPLVAAQNVYKLLLVSGIWFDIHYKSIP